MRLAAGGALLLHGVAALWTGVASTLLGLHLICAMMGMLLIVGLWTPAVGTVAAVAAALALLGPGAWSVDARLFGWRRIEIRDRDAPASRHETPLD
jgi:hypothetical protein